MQIMIFNRNIPGSPKKSENLQEALQGEYFVTELPYAIPK